MERVALLSVHNKDHKITGFARGLVALGFRILASRGTYEHLRRADAGTPDGVLKTNPVDVATLTRVEPSLEHRVVTLHPMIHEGLLATEEMRPELEGSPIPWIDLLCVDLGPIDEAIRAPDATLESVAKATDIGGQALLNSAGKGGRIVVSGQSQYESVLRALTADKVTPAFRLNLQCEAMSCVVAYQQALATFLYRQRMKGAS